MGATKTLEEHLGKRGLARSANIQIADTDGYYVGKLGGLDCALVKQLMPDIEEYPEQPSNGVCKDFQQGVVSFVSKLLLFMQKAKYYHKKVMFMASIGVWILQR